MTTGTWGREVDVIITPSTAEDGFMTDLERYHHWNVTKERKFIERWQRVRERGAFWFILFCGSITAMAMGFRQNGLVWLSTDFDFPQARGKAARSHGRSRGRQG